jgi:hypothetical protein
VQPRQNSQLGATPLYFSQAQLKRQQIQRFRRLNFTALIYDLRALEQVLAPVLRF